MHLDMGTNPTDIAHISLALSGGGHRAAAFHLGVFKYLAQYQLLGDVDHISSVSGGSILVADLMSARGDSKKTGWPGSEDFLATALPAVRHKIINVSLQTDFILRMLNPMNWMKFGHRAELMSASLQQSWGVVGNLQDVPAAPAWYINATSNLNGQRWLFYPDRNGYQMRDEQQAHNAGRVKIADAAAASAAYPVVIGPYLLRYGQPEKQVYLSDGGLYDNLGLEALFNMDSDQLRFNPLKGVLIVSDAGSALKTKKLPAIWKPFSRLRRLINIIGQQVRALRWRSLNELIENQPESIVCLSIGTVWSQLSQTMHDQGRDTPVSLQGYNFLAEAEVQRAAGISTTLASLSESDTDLLIRHGYETALIMFSLSPDERRALHFSC